MKSRSIFRLKLSPRLVIIGLLICGLAFTIDHFDLGMALNVLLAKVKNIGWWWGTVYTTIAAMIGAIIAFLK